MGVDRVLSSIAQGFAELDEAITAFRGDAPLIDDYTMAEITYQGDPVGPPDHS